MRKMKIRRPPRFAVNHGMGEKMGGGWRGVGGSGGAVVWWWVCDLFLFSYSLFWVLGFASRFRSSCAFLNPGSLLALLFFFVCASTPFTARCSLAPVQFRRPPVGAHSVHPSAKSRGWKGPRGARRRAIGWVGRYSRRFVARGYKEWQGYRGPRDTFPGRSLTFQAHHHPRRHFAVKRTLCACPSPSRAWWLGAPPHRGGPPVGSAWRR